MITASIKMYGRSEKRKEIMQTIKGISKRLQEDARCVETSIYQDINDKNIFYLVEEWEDEQQLETHIHSRMFAALLGAGSLMERPPEVKCMVDNGPACCVLNTGGSAMKE